VAAYRKLLDEADAPLFDALWRVEEALGATPFADRILAERRKERPRR
jgi:hypothetical protein